MPTVAQLKAQLAVKGLPTDGVKAVLEARLAAAVPAAAAPAQVDVRRGDVRLGRAGWRCSNGVFYFLITTTRISLKQQAE